MKRVFLIVLDSLGIGEMPDSYLYKDENSNTLKAISLSKNFKCPTLRELGLFNIQGVKGVVKKGKNQTIGSFARLTEKSKGKDTIVGHWEIAGLISKKPFKTFPNGFPDSVIKEFEEKTGKKVICNKVYSGTEVIKDYGEESIKTNSLIVYTSADSVFQVASHEDIVPVKDLYKYCKIARKILKGENLVARVIARPFNDKYPFVRTSNRHDFSVKPPKKTMLNLISESGLEVISIGKINDIFSGSGITRSYKTACNNDGINKLKEVIKEDFNGLCFLNLVDFDMVYGHRNNVDGYAKALSEFDLELKGILNSLKKDDVLIITADHGCDPSTISTDHSREYTPMLIYGENIKSGVNLKTRSSFSDISATILKYFNIDKKSTKGREFLSKIIK